MADVHYTLAISDEALKQLRDLPKEQNYRLRVGDYRVLFRLEGRQISVYAVKDRKEAYE